MTHPIQASYFNKNKRSSSIEPPGFRRKGYAGVSKLKVLSSGGWAWPDDPCWDNTKAQKPLQTASTEYCGPEGTTHDEDPERYQKIKKDCLEGDC